MSSARLEQIATRMKQGVASGEIPGVTIMIARHGKLIFSCAFGYSDRATAAPMTEDTVFALASVSKPVTTVAAMMLVEEGRICLDEPISEYLPQFQSLAVLVERERTDGGVHGALEPLARQPTVQDLMRHTSGLVYGQFGDGAIHKQYLEAKILDPDVPLAEMISRLSKLPLAHQPGSTFEYSVSTDVLGRIVEVVSDEPLDRFIARRITEPLGMASTGFCVSAGRKVALPEPPSAELRRFIEMRAHRQPPLLSGGGGLYGPAGDYLRFGQMLLNGGALDGVRVLGPKTLQLMRSNHLPSEVAVAPNSAALLRILAPTPDMGLGFGLGFAVRLAPGRNPLPGSVADYGWAGSSGAYFWIDPDEDLVVVMLSAQPSPRPKVLYRQLIRQLVYQALDDVAPSRADCTLGWGRAHGPTAVAWAGRDHAAP